MNKPATDRTQDSKYPVRKKKGDEKMRLDSNKTMRDLIKDSMIDEVITKYGFNHPITIKFTKMVETTSNFKLIKATFRSIMA